MIAKVLKIILAKFGCLANHKKLTPIVKIKVLLSS